MTTASQKQIDYINSMIDSIESAPYFANLEAQMEILKDSEDWQDQAKFQMFEGQVKDYYAQMLGIRLRRNPMSLAELKAQTFQALYNLRALVARGLTSAEASQLIDDLKNKKLA